MSDRSVIALRTSAVVVFSVGVILSFLGWVLRPPPPGFLFFGGIFMLVGSILFFVLVLVLLSWRDEDEDD